MDTMVACGPLDTPEVDADDMMSVSNMEDRAEHADSARRPRPIAVDHRLDGWRPAQTSGDLPAPAVGLPSHLPPLGEPVASVTTEEADERIEAAM